MNKLLIAGGGAESFESEQSFSVSYSSDRSRGLCDAAVRRLSSSLPDSTSPAPRPLAGRPPLQHLPHA